MLALDSGTTSSRAILFDLIGAPVSVSQKEFEQHFPQPGWVEHDPEDILKTQIETAKKAIEKGGVEARDIAAIGIANQRETSLVWDRATGAPLNRAIVWQDRRVADLTDRMKAEGLEPKFREKTGLLLDPYFSGGKFAWFLKNIPGLNERARRGEICFGTVDSWLMFRLTGGRTFATDATNASRTLLFNIHTLKWDDELLDIFNIPKTALPEIFPSAGYFCETDPEFFGRSIPITGVAGDQQAALFGQACFKTGMAKNTYGTGSFVMMNSGERPVTGDGILTTLAWQIKGENPVYALEGSIFIAGAAIQWLRDGLALIKSASEVEELARTVKDTGGVYFVPALTGLGTPYWDPHARGLIIGITRGTTRAHLARAAIEAMAYQTRDAIEAMEKAGDVNLRELRVDGGAANNDLLLDFQAGLIGAPVLRPKVTETTAIGAAYLAGVGIDLMDQESISSKWATDRRFEPAMSQEHRDDLTRGWKRAVTRSLGWANKD